MFSLAMTTLRLLKAIIRSWRFPEFRAALVLAVLILFSGTMFYRTVEGWSWIDALYFSVNTISTVGMSELSPQTDLGKIFTMLYIFVGVGLFVALFSQIARALILYDKDTDRGTEGERSQ